MKKAKFLVSHFDAGVEKFKKGASYPLDDETRLCIARGAAEEVEVADEPVADATGDAAAGSEAAAVATTEASAAEAKPAKGKK